MSPARNKIVDISDIRRHGEKLLRKLVMVSSFTSDVDGLKKVAGIVCRELEAMGFSTEIMPGYTSFLVGRLGPQKDSVLCIGHMDTVYPKVSPFKITGRKIYGAGAADMKGGIVVLIEALRLLLNHPLFAGPIERGITVCMTGDEETGCQEGRAFLEKYAPDSSCCLSFEPGRRLPNAQGELIPSYLLERRGNAVFGGVLQGEKPLAALASIVSTLLELNSAEDDVTTNICPGAEWPTNVVMPWAAVCFDKEPWASRIAELRQVIEKEMRWKSEVSVASEATGTRIVFKGRQYHGGMTHKLGINSFGDAMIFLSKIDEMYGSLEGAGVEIPSGETYVEGGQHFFRGELRVPTVEMRKTLVESIDKTIAEPGKPCDITYRIILRRPPFERSPDSEKLSVMFEEPSEIGGASLLPEMVGSSGGLSDANFCAALGIPTIDCIGVVGGDFHVFGSEWLLRRSLYERTLRSARLLKKLCREPLPFTARGKS